MTDMMRLARCAISFSASPALTWNDPAQHFYEGQERSLLTVGRAASR